MEGRLTEVDEEEDEEEEQWFKRHGALGSTLEDELLSVDPALLAPAKVEMDMLQKEKAEWERERERLEKKTREIARARDDLVRYVRQYVCICSLALIVCVDSL